VAVAGGEGVVGEGDGGLVHGLSYCR